MPLEMRLSLVGYRPQRGLVLLYGYEGRELEGFCEEFFCETIKQLGYAAISEA